MTKCLLVFLVVVLAFVAAAAAQASTDPRSTDSSKVWSDQASAESACQAGLTYEQTVLKVGIDNACTLSGSGEGGWNAAAQCYASGAFYELYGHDYTGPYKYHWCYGNNLPQCVAGKSDWPTVSYSDGTNCDDGCLTVFTVTIGGDSSSGFSQSGAVCPYNAYNTMSTVPPPVPSTPDGTTCNPDGTCTYCANGYCVSSNPDPPQQPPAPASSSPNNSTDSHTDSTTPASTSTSSTSTTSSTTTTGGDSGGTGGTSGGTGDSTSTTTGTSTTTTTTPASSSSSDTKCTTGVCDVGNADGNVGDLYSDSTDTPQSVFSSYMTQIKTAPIVSAATGFFTVNVSGSCPSWHIPGNAYWGASGFDFTFFCQSAMLTLFQLAGYLVLAGGAFCAFRIAIY